ncbi:crosslink repair DNA glycosylase YcaQ family protein [Leifsonia sp. F6_8S_P_1B]|uniref:Crosslink repair DNA glycosylase YcaQ family protein n=1 Tax=Leifsonia williamsii TaxID=3035919 RepID=A0ABT8KB01_9MICO|nr:crosslink repair DNA glycosylase YcaQ family protein [Leifsonia williamsii]MDN4614634.1 crosslink repair DNA glycosylase YcaQ family protein [Leifsonia williamsii]
MTIHLERDEARRIAVRAQRLDADRPGELVPLVEHLTFLQLDPTAAVAPSADLIAFTRLGADYRPEQLRAALEEDRLLYELKAQDDPVTPPFAMIRPVSDLPLLLDRMSAGPEHGGWRAWLAANPRFRQDVLDRLRAEGPLLSKDIPDTAQTPWVSSGWTHEQNVTRMLEALAARGEIAVAGRIGRQRTWDLTERLHPDLPEPVPEEQARPLRDERRLRSLGIARPQLVGEAGDEATVEGSRLRWRVDPALVGAEAVGAGFRGRTALLSPFDRLVHDRIRTQEVFGFEYLLEMYKPAAKRRWGYFALPILHDDRLIGKLDATADRKAGLLRVAAVHEDEHADAATREAVRTAVDQLAAWQGLTVAWP